METEKFENVNGPEQTAFSLYMRDAMFLFPEGKKQLLQKVITALDELYERDIKDRGYAGQAGYGGA